MKAFFVLLAAWYLQDLIQIAMTQTFLAPDLFLIALIWCVTQEPDTERLVPWLAAAFLGGLLTDLRWIGVPGFCAALYIAAFLAARLFWFQVPAESRRMLPYLVISGGLCMAVSPLRLLFWHASVIEGRRASLLMLQWGMTAVMVLLSALMRPYVNEDDQDF